jgi:antitoxin ParD1/3/4
LRIKCWGSLPYTNGLSHPVFQQSLKRVQQYRAFCQASVDENFTKTEVLSGFYTNETELVRDAVRRMREEKERAKRFQEAVAKGLQAVECGETFALTPDLLQEIKQDTIHKVRNGEPYKSMS